MLTCSYCKSILPTTSFPKDKTNKLRGHSYACKSCSREIRNKRADKEAARKHKWVTLNKKKKQKQNNEYLKRRRNKDSVFNLKLRIAQQIRNTFNLIGKGKDTSTLNIVGLSAIELYMYLLETYKNRYNEYPVNLKSVHIDHIVPICLASGLEDVYRLNHYTNLQLLRSQDNMSKGARLDWK